MSGGADALVAWGGVAVEDNDAGAGRGACLAIHHSQATNPMTQSIMTIHAVRSIKLAAPAIHRPATWQELVRKFFSERDRARNRPTAGSARPASNRASCRAQPRAVRPLPKNSESKWVQIDSLNRGRRAPTTKAKSSIGKSESEPGEFSAWSR